MKINIYGSTGIIGSKTLKLLIKYFPEIKINLLFANNNYNKLISQCKIYKPQYICIKNSNLINKIKPKIKKNITIIEHKNLFMHLNKEKTDLSVLAISGYQALDYFNYILNNTKYLGLVNKEVIVSIGHLFREKNFLKKTIIFPLDSEHFSLFHFFKNNKTNIKNIKNIYITASGGPFLNIKKNLNDVTLSQAIKHPKWKMGIKNSIDSATLANKCLELIEAHYLFDIPNKKLKIFIHPESLVHSIVELNNGTSIFNYFYNDMDIPIINFFSYVLNKNIELPRKFLISNDLKLNFSKPNTKIFPIYNSYNKYVKNSIAKKIMFNVINELAVELFKQKKIKFTDISKFVDKYLSLDLKMPLTDIKKVVEFQNNIKRKIELNENK